jgi:DNA polymerase V
MKVKEILKLDSRFNFEAKLMNASPKTGSSLGLSPVEQLDLRKILIGEKSEMMIVRVCGQSMVDKNINDGDLLIVESVADAKQGDVVIASLNGELTVKTLIYENGKPILQAANKQFFPIEIGEFYQFEIQGIVRHVIKHI